MHALCSNPERSSRLFCVAMTMITATAIGSSAAIADTIAGGVLTADVTLAVKDVLDGQPFPAVINPDANYDAIGKTLPTNTSGTLYGDINAPTEFNFTDLPVYAIVDGTGAPWNPSEPLFEADDLSLPRFFLQHVGDFSLALKQPEIEGTPTQYETYVSTFHCVATGALFDVTGTAYFELPPWGLPNWAWYGMNPGSIDLEGYVEGEFGLAMYSNDDGWASGWPGTTLDKSFFPAPEPATVVLLLIGGPAMARRRR